MRKDAAKQSLPENTGAALNAMITLTQDVIIAYESETNAIAVGGELEFLQSTAQKQSLGHQYNIACQEFLARKEEFSRFGGEQLQKLAALQERLRLEAKTNMTLLEPLRDQLQDNQKPESIK